MSEVRLDGKLINRQLRLLRFIFTGAFSQIYSAIDHNAAKKIVAIKLEENEKFKPEGLILDILQMMRRQYKTYLKHSGLVYIMS